MKTGTIIAIALGVIGAATGGYILYRRKQSNNVLQQAQQDGTVQTPVQAISQFEGKAFRLNDGRIYVVKNNVLRHVANQNVMQREFGTKDWNLLLASGVGSNVASLPTGFTEGEQLTGFNKRLLR